MDRPYTIQIPVRESNSDWKTAQKHIFAYDDIVFVEMDEIPDRIGSILLPPEMAGHSRPDSGTVVAAGPLAGEVSPGERVLVMPYNGNWFEDVKIGNYQAKHLRVYGIASKDSHLPIKENWHLSIPATLGPDYPQAVKEWVFIRRDPLQETEKGIVLTEREKYRNQLATVISAGGLCTCKPSNRVMYHGQALMIDTEFLKVKYPNLPGSAKDYAFIKERDLYAVVED